MTRERLLGLLGRTFALGLLLLGAAVMLAPFLWMALSSVKGEEELLTFPPVWFPHTFRWENYPEAFAKIHFWRCLLNTVTITLGCALGQVLASAVVGYGFARFRFRGRNLLFIVLLSTMMLPGQVTMIPVFLLFKALGWVDTFRPLVVPSFFGGSAMYVFLFRQFFLSVPRELEEAARMDGCGAWGIFVRIILPLSKPVIATVAVFTFLATWNDFLGPLIYLNSPENHTLALALNEFRGQHGPRYMPQLMAVSLVTLAPCIVLFFVAQRVFIKSLATAAVKG